MSMIIGAAVGALLGAGGLFVWHLRRVAGLSQEYAGLRTRNDVLSEQQVRLAEEVRAARAETADMSTRREQTELEAARLAERLREQQRQFDEQRKIIEEARTALTDTFKAHAATALKDNREQFITQADEKLKPIKELLEKHGVAVTQLEEKRTKAYTQIEEQIKFIASSHEKLSGQTEKLVTALRRSNVRGQWGELQLRNAVEMAGMTAQCDFAEQVLSDDSSVKPDMVVKLPGGGAIPVDSKCVLDAYLDALDPANDRGSMLQRHAAGLRDQMKRLASKEYWKQFERAPQIVVMFVPLESALTAALEVDPNLHVEAMRSHVLIVSPTLLVALLRAVAFGWQQEDIARNASEIAEVGKELYERICTFASHMEKMGRGLAGATESYNKAVGSLESRILVSARRFRELGATKSHAEIDFIEPVDLEVREITSAELRPLPDA